MLARILAALPSVRTARDLACAQERLARYAEILAVTCRERDEERQQRVDVQAKYDRLVEARLLRASDIAQPFTAQPKTSRPLATGAFGTLGRMVHATPPSAPQESEPVGVDVTG